MTIGWTLLVLFYLGYAALSSAVIWHLDEYSFSRKAHIASTAFIAVALFLGMASIFFYSQIDWHIIINNSI